MSTSLCVYVHGPHACCRWTKYILLRAYANYYFHSIDRCIIIYQTTSTYTISSIVHTNLWHWGGNCRMYNTVHHNYIYTEYTHIHVDNIYIIINICSFSIIRLTQGMRIFVLKISFFSNDPHWHDNAFIWIKLMRVFNFQGSNYSRSMVQLSSIILTVATNTVLVC